MTVGNLQAVTVNVLHELLCDLHSPSASSKTKKGIDMKR